jgi:hypothetical protein
MIKKKTENMAILEEITPAPDDERKELVVIEGGLALRESIDIKPVAPPPYGEFSQTVPDESQWEGKSLQELLAIREELSAYMGEKAAHIHQQIQDHDAVHYQILRINGWIRDRQQ